MLHKVNKSASYIYRISSRTSVVTQQEGLEIKLWFATSAKENIVAKNTAWVFTIKNCNGTERETETLTSSNPAPNLRKSVRIAPASHNLLQGQDRYMYSHTTSFLLSQHRKAGGGSAIAVSPTPVPVCGNRGLLSLLLPCHRSWIKLAKSLETSLVRTRPEFKMLQGQKQERKTNT